MREALTETGVTHQPKWYSAIVSSAHEGAGRRGDHMICVEAENAISALDKLNLFPGWKRNMKRHEMFPAIKELTEEEARDFEQSIVGAHLNLVRAKAVGIDTRILEQARRGFSFARTPEGRSRTP